jgi:hypothetical protein
MLCVLRVLRVIYPHMVPQLESDDAHTDFGVPIEFGGESPDVLYDFSHIPHVSKVSFRFPLIDAAAARIGSASITASVPPFRWMFLPPRCNVRMTTGNGRY